MPHDTPATYCNGQPRRGQIIRRRRALSRLAGLTLAAAGCQRDINKSAARPQVTVYTALDEEFSRPILRIYARKHGVDVRPFFDIESTKSFGLAARIISEADAPLCDLFWNNEILNALRLKRLGLLDAYSPPGADAIPATFRDPDRTWFGFAARARILLVNIKLVRQESRPRGLADLIDPKWRGQVAIAKPLFGTTATHAAALFATWGDAEAQRYFRALKQNDVRVLSGNRQVAADVAAGRVAFGLTDTDDALLEVEAGNPVTIVYPDRDAGQLGTLFVPTTLSRIKNCAHPDAATSLASYLLSPEVEKALALGPSGQIPLNPAVDVKLRVESPKTVRPMTVDFDKAATLWQPVVAPFLAEIFAGTQ